MGFALCRDGLSDSMLCDGGGSVILAAACSHCSSKAPSPEPQALNGQVKLSIGASMIV